MPQGVVGGAVLGNPLSWPRGQGHVLSLVGESAHPACSGPLQIPGLRFEVEVEFEVLIQVEP